MTRLTLHVGHPKTGTTALQSVLFANAETLLEKGSVLYPTQTKPVKIKHALAIPWLLGVEYEAVRRSAHASDDKLTEISQEFWQAITTEIAAKQPEHLILSAEGFWVLRKASEAKRATFKETINAIATHVAVAGYLKSPAPYFTSMINQKLRNFREVQLPKRNFYRASMQAWEDMGFDDYQWRIFDRRCLVNQDIIDDFCAHHLPAPLSSQDLNREGVEDANSSVSNEALVILEELANNYPDLQQNIYDHRRYKVVDILREADTQVGGRSRPCLTEAAAAAIVARCDDLAWLLDRGLSFPDLDPALINAANPPVLERFTRVADFCPVDSDRLASLRSCAMERIDQLFKPRSRRSFWPFKALRGLSAR